MSRGPQETGHRTNRLLAALEPKEFAVLEPHLEIVALSRGEVLYETDETLRFAYFPHNAVVSLVTVMENGQSAEMAAFGREAALGLVSAAVSRTSLGRYIVQMPGLASRIDIDQMHKIIATRPTIRKLFLSLSEALFAQILLSVACNAVHTVEARCCRCLLGTRDRIEQDTLPLTHEILAEMLGVQRSTVSIVTRTLQTAGLITQGRGVITIVDAAGLEKISCECYRKNRQTFERLLPGTYTRKRVGG